MNHCILILGMHRSGTSAYAGALQLLGVEFGEPLMPARAGENDRGFFEQLDMYRVHEELLCALGRPWDDLRPLPSGWLDSPPAGFARKRLGELVRSQFAASRLWAIKDPRLCRLLPLWKQVLASFDVCVHFLIVWRDPVEVASSLKNRNGFSIEKAGLLWANHNLEVERETRRYERCFASYHQLLEDPARALTHLATLFDMDWPNPVTGSARKLNAFIDHNLNRARGDQLVAADLGRSVQLVDSLKQLLASSDSAKSTASAEFDLLDKRYSDVIQQLDPMLLEHVSSNSFQIGRLENRIERLERELDERTHWLKVQAGEIDSLANRWERRGFKKLRRRLRARIKTSLERCRNWLAPRESPRGEPNEMLHEEGQLLAKLAQVQELTRPGGTDTSNIVLQETKHPVVSVVIPVHNQISVTLQCLESISASTERTPYEVIVVDDASTDGTSDRLAAISHLRIVRNQSNLGFVDSINQGVLAARGKFVLLLNNDTIVQEGWLDHLARTFDDFDNVGLVGSKLISADGKLQEAGGVIWRDGTGLNVGRGKPHDTPQFNYAREVDYCSAPA